MYIDNGAAATQLAFWLAAIVVVCILVGFAITLVADRPRNATRRRRNRR
jgi:hypothetical protein